MSMKKLLFLISLILLPVGAFYIFSKKRQATIVEPIKTEKPIRKALVQMITASGNLKAKEQISVGSLVAGKVVDIKVEDNDIVKKDQVLAVLDDGVGDTETRRLTATLAEAKANYIYLEKFYKRQTALYKSGQISQNNYDQITRDLEMAKTKVDQTKAALDLSMQTYNNLFIKSPANGIVIAKRIDLGQMVTAVLQATVLFEIAKDLHEMEAWLDVDEADIGMVKEGQEAIFTVDSFPKKHFEGKVKRIQYQAKIVDNVVTYATVLDVKNPKLRLRPGMTANVEIKVAENTNALVVSNKALRINPINIEYVANKLKYKLEKVSVEEKLAGQKSKKIMKDYVWILDNKTLKQIEVKIGNNDGKFIEIKKGLEDNANVIIEVEAAPRDNPLSKLFPQAGGIGKK
ncbi:MAG: efflux RND transporter periplasmic adaptor subunit [bacterium]